MFMAPFINISDIMEVSFIINVNQSTQRKVSTCYYTVYNHNGIFPLKYALRDTLGISNGSFVMKRMSTSGKATY